MFGISVRITIKNLCISISGISLSISLSVSYYDVVLISPSLLSNPSRVSLFWDFSSSSSYRRLEMSCLISLSSPEKTAGHNRFMLCQKQTQYTMFLCHFLCWFYLQWSRHSLCQPVLWWCTVWWGVSWSSVTKKSEKYVTFSSFSVEQNLTKELETTTKRVKKTHFSIPGTWWNCWKNHILKFCSLQATRGSQSQFHWVKKLTMCFSYPWDGDCNVTETPLEGAVALFVELH